MTEGQLYTKATRLAFLALGKKPGRMGRGYTRPFIADDDPLAHWELTERIIELAKASTVTNGMRATTQGDGQ